MLKNLLLAALIAMAAACSKTKEDKPVSAFDSKDKPQACRFGQTEFNLTKRSFIQETFIDTADLLLLTGKAAPPPAAVILLDMDGCTVSNTSWNVNGNIVCAPANLTVADMAVVMQRVVNDYSPFNVTVTTNEALYNSAPVAKRTRVIITESWEWYGQSGGVSYIGSFTWGDNTPCFVFSSLLGYNIKMIAEAASHEAGHTLGLYHQSSYNVNCAKTSEYNSGQGSGETGWAPIMGNGYYQNLTLWHNGTSANGCTSFQNDIGIISGVIGFKTDDYPNSVTGAPSVNTTMNGIINSNTDIDYFKVTLTSSKTVNLTPVNVGAGNAGGNMDLVLKIYNSGGLLLNTVNNAGVLNAGALLTAGTYYVSAGVAANSNATSYGMLGNYTISLN